MCLFAQSCPTLWDPMTVAHQAPLPMRFSRQGYWSGYPFPPPRGIFPTQGLNPWLLPRLLHCRQIFFFKPLSPWGNPYINIASLFTIINILLILLYCIYKTWFKQTPQEISVSWGSEGTSHTSCSGLQTHKENSAWHQGTTQVPCWHLKLNMSGPPLTSWALLCRPWFTPTSPVSWITIPTHSQPDIWWPSMTPPSLPSHFHWPLGSFLL